jgi:hypothetical protein
VSHLLLLAVAVTVATFLVRLVLPFETDNKYVDLNMWEWPACAALFGLGIMTSRMGWLAAVPDRLRRQEPDRDTNWPSVRRLRSPPPQSPWVSLATESTLSVFGSVWLLGVAQRRLNRSFRWARPVVSRSSYGTFMLQGLVLIGLAIALRPLPLPAEVKALIVAAGGVVGSFALAWLLISRVPWGEAPPLANHVPTLHEAPAFGH